jgi:Protein tyrosine and serine/threonine kinase
MAPEVLNRKTITDKADVYSFGLVLWELAAEQL